MRIIPGMSNTQNAFLRKYVLILKMRIKLQKWLIFMLKQVILGVKS